MKIRIGIGAAAAASSPAALAEILAALDELRFDSLWLSEVLTGPVLDPAVGLAWAAATNPRVKLGTTMLLPGQNVIRLAKQLARLDSIDAALAWAATKPIVRVQPGFIKDDVQTMLTLPGDPLHPTIPGWEIPEDTRFVLQEGKRWTPVRP